jgi:Transposase IS4
MLSLFESLKHNYHRVWMDNLYLSTKFVRDCYLHDLKIMLAGVVRKGGRGAPPCIMQNEVTNKNDVKYVRGTVKAAVLKGDDDCPNMIALSVYDSKPVYFLSMIHDRIEWVENTNVVFCQETNKNETNKFLRLNINTDYNFKMNDVNQADQLRNCYRFDHWMRKRKWWWSIFFGYWVY